MRPAREQHLPNVTSVVVIGLMLVLYLAPFADMDFGILIRLGELIIDTGQLRPPESFSYTIAGRDVRDFEWLFEVGSWGIWSAFGYGGLKLLKVLLVGGTLVVTGLHLRSEGVRWHGIALALGLAMVIVASGWNLRPLYFTTLGLLLVSWWLRDHCTGKRPLTWWLVPVMLVWANVHPGVIIGQALLLMAIGWEWVNRWLRVNPLPLAPRGRGVGGEGVSSPLSPVLRGEGPGVRGETLQTPHPNPSRLSTGERGLCGASLWRLTLIGGLGLAATFLSPEPVERLLLPFRPELRHPIQRIVKEMTPLYVSAFHPPSVDLLAYVLAALVVLTIVFRFREYRLWEIGLMAGLGVLANMATRSLQDWVLVMLSLGVPHMARLLREASRQRRRAWVALLLRLDRSVKSLFVSPLFRFQWRWPALAFAVMALISVIPPVSRAMPWQAREVDPVAAVDWIETHNPPGPEPWRIFAPPDYGAYLVWRLDDRVRDYVDTRSFCFPPELLEDAHLLPQLAPGWQGRLKRVLAAGTQYFLLEVSGTRGALAALLKKNGAQPLYEDGRAVLFTAEEVQRKLGVSGDSAASDGSG